MEKTKRILVPMGFCEHSLNALDQAILIAKKDKSEIILISVVESNSFWQNMFGKHKDEASLKEEVLKKLTKLIKKRKKSGVHMEPLVSTGNVHEEIIRVANMIVPEVLIMGTKGQPDHLNTRLLGSNAYRVTMHVKEPIITLRENQKLSKIKSMVFPIVLDSRSKEKVGDCLHWSRIFKSEVRVVAVAKEKGDYAKLLPHVVQVSDFINKHGVPANYQIIDAEGRRTPTAVIDFSKRVNSDMIIITEEENYGVPTKLSNDVEEVLYNSEVPVMFVTPRPAKYGSGFQAF